MCSPSIIFTRTLGCPFPEYERWNSALGSCGSDLLRALTGQVNSCLYSDIVLQRIEICNLLFSKANKLSETDCILSLIQIKECPFEMSNTSNRVVTSSTSPLSFSFKEFKK